MPGRGMTFAGSQDTIGPTPHLIHGLGQQAGGFSELGLTTPANAAQPEWGNSILIAQGTYSGEASDFMIDTSAADLMANVFIGANDWRSTKADVHVVGTNGFSYAPLLVPPTPPEPPAPPAPPEVVEPPTVPPPPETPAIEEPVVEIPPPAIPERPHVLPVLPVDPNWPTIVTLPYVRPHPWYYEEWCVGSPIQVPAIIDLTDYDWTTRYPLDGDIEAAPVQWFVGDPTDAIQEFKLIALAPDFADDRLLTPVTVGTTFTRLYNDVLTNTRTNAARLFMSSTGQLFYLADAGVPEPSTALLAWLAVLTLMTSSRRRHNRGASVSS
jgi:hypothetical protein